MDPDHILLFLLKKLDDQNVPAAVQCLTWALLHNALHRLGRFRSELEWAVWGNGFLAMDQSGASLPANRVAHALAQRS